jgi:predicted nucleic acid-binding protein
VNFWEASAIVRALDPDEAHHGRARRLAEQHTRHASSRLLELEVTAALARSGAPSPARHGRLAEARRLIGSMELHAVDPALAEAAELARRHRLRALDSIYLATARLIRRHFTRSLLFISANRELLQAAAAEGMRTAELA